MGQVEGRRLGVLAVGADDLAEGVDPPGHGGPGSRVIDASDGAAAVAQEAVEPSFSVDVGSHGLAGLVRAEGRRERGGVWDIDGGEDAVVRHEPTASDTDVVLVLAGSRISPSELKPQPQMLPAAPWPPQAPN